MYCTGTVVTTQTIFFLFVFLAGLGSWIFVVLLFLVTACSPLPTKILNLPVAWFFIFNVQYHHLNRHLPLCELEICLMEAATTGDIREIISVKQQVVGGIQIFPRGWFCILYLPSKSIALSTFPDKLCCLIPLLLRLSHTSPKNVVEWGLNFSLYLISEFVFQD